MHPMAANSPVLVQKVLFAAHLCRENPSALTVVSLLFPLCSAALKGTWQSGFFDQGSFQEIMRPWAQTVVVGRARYCWVQGGASLSLPSPGAGRLQAQLRASALCLWGWLWEGHFWWSRATVCRGTGPC